MGDARLDYGFRFQDNGINTEPNGKVDATDNFSMIVNGYIKTMSFRDYDSSPFDDLVFGKKLSDIYAEVKEAYLQKCKKYIS